MTQCDLSVARTSEGFVIRVLGKGTSVHSRAMEAFVKECFSQTEQATAIVDLRDCQYLDSTFLGCLLKLQRIGKNGRFSVVADEPTRIRLLATTHIDAYLNLTETSPEAIGCFLSIEVSPLSRQELGRHMMETHQALSEVPGECSTTFARIASELRKELRANECQSDPQNRISS